MTTHSTARVRRDQPPPSEGTVEVRLCGRSADLDALIALMRAAGITVWHSPKHVYPDRNGVTVRRYLTVDLREPQP